MADGVIIKVTLGDIVKRLEQIENGQTGDIQGILQDLKTLRKMVEFLNENKVGTDSITNINSNIGLIIKDVGIINALLAGNITSENIQTGGITSDKLVISNGFIKDAMINDLNALKINTGVLRTNLVTVQSEKGNLNLIDNTLQILDEEGNLRVSLGEYEGDYNLVVRAKDGKTVIFDSNGVTEKGIQEGIIKDIHIEKGTITGRKIDISSLITVINQSEGEEKLLSSKVILDEKGQSLNVVFGDLTKITDNLTETTKNLLTDFSVEQGKISQLIEDTTIEKDGKTTKLKDAYSRTVQEIDQVKSTIGEQETIIDNLTGTVTSTTNSLNELVRTVDGMSSTIANTEIKIEGIGDRLDNLSISDTNLVLNSSFMSGDTSFWESTGSGTVHEVVLDSEHDYALKTTKQFIIGSTTLQGYVKKDDRMCITFYAKSNVPSTFTGGHITDGGAISISDKVAFATTTVWKKYTFLFNSLNDGLDTHKIYFYGAGEDSKILYLSKIKLSVSNRDTSWTPSPQDSDLFMNKIQENLDSITNDNIVSILEKRQLLVDFENIKSDNKTIVDSCNKYKVDLNTANYQYNYNQLYAYLYGANGLLLNPSIQTSINRQEFSTKYNNYFNSRTEIKNAITTASKNFVDESIDNLQIVNRNLVLNSTFTLGEDCLDSWNNVDNKFVVMFPEDDKPSSGILYIQSYGSTQNNIYSAYSNKFKLIPQEPYTISLDFKVDYLERYDLKNPLIIEMFSGTEKLQTEEMTIYDMGVETIENGKWYRLSKTIKPKDDRIMTGHIRLTLYKNGSSYYREIKFEKGTKATEWSPAPEDTDTKITTVSNRVSKLDQDLDGITARVSKTELTQTEVSGVLKGYEERISSAEAKLTSEGLDVIISKSETITNMNTSITETYGKIEDMSTSISETYDKIENMSTSISETNDKIEEVAKEVTYTVEIISSNGSIFKNGNINTTLTAIVRKGIKDVTDTIDSSKFIWTRVSDDKQGDILWNQSNAGGKKSVTITSADVRVRATFNCEILE